MKKISFLLAIAFLVGSFALSSCKGKDSDPSSDAPSVEVSGDPFELSFNPKEGQSWAQSFEMDADISTEAMGQKMDMPMTMMMTWDMAVMPPSGSNAVMDMTITRVKMTMDNPMMNINYDSEDEANADDPANAAMGQAFGAMINKPITMVYDAAGAVIETKGMDAILAQSGMTQEQMEQMGASFSESMKSYMPIYPDKPIRVGESWTHQVQANSNGNPFIADNTYTVTDRKDGKVTLHLSSKLSADENAIANSENPNLAMVEEMTLSGTQTGELIVDEESGMVVNGDFTQDMDIQMKVMGMDVPTTLKSKVSLSSN